jgi:hypothetical protein
VASRQSPVATGVTWHPRRSRTAQQALLVLAARRSMLSCDVRRCEHLAAVRAPRGGASTSRRCERRAAVRAPRGGASTSRRRRLLFEHGSPFDDSSRGLTISRDLCGLSNCRHAPSFSGAALYPLRRSGLGSCRRREQRSSNLQERETAEELADRSACRRSRRFWRELHPRRASSGSSGMALESESQVDTAAMVDSAGEQSP